jgi:hypothetical protein
MENYLKETFITIKRKILNQLYILKIIRDNFIIKIDKCNAKIVIIKRKNKITNF